MRSRMEGADGAQAGGYSYTPYGLATHTGTATTPLKYTGQYTDAESGLVYMGARYYDPATAQFLTVDPLVNITDAPYSYVGDGVVAGIGAQCRGPSSGKADTCRSRLAR